MRSLLLLLLAALPQIAAAAIEFTSTPPTTVQVGQEYSYRISAVVVADDDDDGGDGDGRITFSTTPLPSWLELREQDRLVGTPGAGDVGLHVVMITATSEGEAPAMQAVSITVVPAPNAPPRLDRPIPAQSATEGAAYRLDAGTFFSDPDGDDLTFAASGLPAGLAIDAATGAIAGAPATGTAGSHTIAVTASDGAGATAQGQFSLTIAAANQPPQLTGPITPDPQNATEGAPYSFDVRPFFRDPDGGALAFAASGLPAGLAIDAAGGSISGAPAEGTAGPHSVTVSASDGSAAASDAFTLVVTAVNQAPALTQPIAPDPQSAIVGERYRLDVSRFFADPDGDALSFAASGLPPSLSIVAASGVIAGTPTSADAPAGSSAQFSVTVSASDGTVAASDQFTLIVTAPVDDPPSLPDPPPPLTTREDTPLTITADLLDAVDEDPGSLTVQLTAPAADAPFTVTGGGAAVTPKRDFVGTFEVEARVRDAAATSNAVLVSITVTAVNDAPRIVAIPAQTATERTPFTLELARYVTDVEQDPLEYRATGLPPGLSIDASTGVVAGAPEVGAEAGEHLVRLTVDDGDDEAQAEFRITIVRVGRADLQTTVAAAPSPVLVGAPSTWTISVQNGGSVDVGNASLEAVFTGDVPFEIATAAAGCTVEPRGNERIVRCLFAPLLGGTAQAVDVTSTASEAGTLGVAAKASIVDAAPVDDAPDNDQASVTLHVTARLSSGAAQQVTAAGAIAAAAGDYNGDSVDVLAVATAGEPTLIFLNAPSSASAHKLALTSVPISAGEAVAASDIAAADLDADGDVDLAVAATDGRNSVLVNGGGASFTTTVLEGGSAARAVAIADVDGDGLADVVFANDGRSGVYRGRGAATFELTDELAGGSVDVAAANLVGDPLPELVFANAAADAAVYRRDGQSFTLATTLATGPATSVATADFDGDGDLDLAFGRGPGAQGGSSDLVFLNNSTSSAPAFFLADELGISSTVDLMAGDFNVDGRADVVSIDANGSHQLFTNGGAANTAFLLHPEQFTTPGAIAAALGEFNPDARLDAAVVAGGSVFVFYNDGRGNLGPGDVGAPTLTLQGEPTISLTVGSAYQDPGATATDDMDGDLSAKIVVDNPVDTNVIGSYTVKYDVVDTSGNAAQTLTRRVEVMAREGSGGGGGGAFGLDGMLLGLLAAMLRARRAFARMREPQRAGRPATRRNSSWGAIR